MINVGWATGGGAAQILFTVFGEIVFNRGPAGLGIDLGLRRHRAAHRRRAGVYAGTPPELRQLQAHHRDLLRRARRLVRALQPDAQFRAGRSSSSRLSRAGVGVSSVLNMSQLLRIVPDEFRGRVFATMESLHLVGDDAFDAGWPAWLPNTGTRARSAPWPARSAPPPRYSGAGRI